MSNKSGVSNQAISLPQGGGSLQGIGETFSADPQTGTGNYTVPLDLPPGRDDFQPDLKLQYSTGQGNGPFGLGWKLSLPDVRRKTSTGVPRYRSGEDAFLLSGAEDLVPVRTESHLNEERTVYRPRTEGLFSRIVRHRSESRDYWTVRNRNGLLNTYGSNPGNPVLAELARPDRPSDVFLWRLSRTEDSLGNRIEYLYSEDDDPSDRPGARQIYLDEIRYTNYRDQDQNQERFLVSVHFEYEGRPDPFSSHRSGFEIRTRKRCRRIRIETHADQSRLLRTYDFDYLDERIDSGGLPATAQPANGVSLLSQVRVTGHREEEVQSLPPLEFQYGRFNPDRRDLRPVTGDLPVHSLDNPDLELADLTGDGLPDLLEMNGTVRYWTNRGDGDFDGPQVMERSPGGLRLGNPDTRLMDADGDGRVELMVNRNGQSGYYRLEHDGEWSDASHQSYDVAPSVNPRDPQVQFVDLTGDGVIDALRSGTRFECFFQDSDRGWSETRRVRRRTADVFPDISLADPRVSWGDMAGDGLQDLVRIGRHSVEYWPNRGWGEWGERVSMENAPGLPEDFDPDRVLLGDVDGDGVADLVYVENNRVRVWINQSGNGWSEPIEVPGTPPVTRVDAVRLVDLYGCGVSGILWTRDRPVAARDHYYFLDLTGRTHPYLLESTDNHMGARTNIEYRTSTDEYREDQSDPDSRWQTRCPFPVPVVSTVTVHDEFTGGTLTKRYRYHDGYWDGVEREFRGFGRVEEWDAETLPEEELVASDPALSPPTMTRSWFHLGPVAEEGKDWRERDPVAEYWSGDPPLLERSPGTEELLASLGAADRRDAQRALRGRMVRSELYVKDGSDRSDRPYTVTEAVHDLREVASPDSGTSSRRRIFFPFKRAGRVTQWDRGHDPRTQIDVTGDIDAHGQPRRKLQVGVPRGRDLRTSRSDAEPYLTTLTETQYAKPAGDREYPVDRVASVTSYEIENTGGQSLLDHVQSALVGDLPRQITGQTLNFYDGDPYTGREWGTVGDHGLPVRTETLVLTEEILWDAYPESDEAGGAERLYFKPVGDASWPADYPDAFLQQLPVQNGEDPTRPGFTRTPLGYGIPVNGPGPLRPDGFYLAGERYHYDVQTEASGQGMILGSRDPVGNETRYDYDFTRTLLVSVTDPVGLITSSDYDYRVLEPRRIEDPNGKTTIHEYTPLGMVASRSIRGTAGEGDSPGEPGERFEYDFGAFVRERQPVSVRTVQRLYHAGDPDAPAGDRDRTLEKVEYSDGFGRLLQVRARAEDHLFGEDEVFGDATLPADPEHDSGDEISRFPLPGSGGVRVVVEGWVTRDNKGRVIERYDPFFDTGWEYRSRSEARAQARGGGPDRFGRRTRFRYDARGRAERTIRPDGSEGRRVPGVPDPLSSPASGESTSWVSTHYDSNDNAGRTHGQQPGDRAYRDHWDTPRTEFVDARGRTVEQIERTREPTVDGNPGSVRELRTRFEYDIQDNLLTVVDPQGRIIQDEVFNLGGQPLRLWSRDAGLRRRVLDAAGNEVEWNDTKGARSLQSYDSLHRPLRTWARDRTDHDLTLRQRSLYGDRSDPNQNPIQRDDARSRYLLGRLERTYDGAGSITVHRRDFVGNETELERLFIRDERVPDVFTERKVNDWTAPAGTTFEDHADTLLEDRAYRQTARFDALNRVVSLKLPETPGDTSPHLEPRYNESGNLRAVELDGESIVHQLAYNARGERTLAALGNGILVRYAYDKETARLSRVRCESYRSSGPGHFRPADQSLFDRLFQYDRVGNVRGILDRSPGSGVRDNPRSSFSRASYPRFSEPDLPRRLAAGDAMLRSFDYDPLYRLTGAVGRHGSDPPATKPWDDAPRRGYNQGSLDAVNAPRETEVYESSYEYDDVGNLTGVTRQSGNNSVAKSFRLDPDSNRVSVLERAQREFPYLYDRNGNLIRENGVRHYEWDYGDRLRHFRVQAADGGPSLEAYYLYDGQGRRVKKVVRKGARRESTHYLDGLFEHRRWEYPDGHGDHAWVHVMDGEKRVALRRYGPAHPEATGPGVQYHLADQINSSHMVLDGDGDWINREEYYPFGGTSLGSFSRKRYRFTGVERDEESGLGYHGARFYAPWLGRWTSPDPAGSVDGFNLYAYVRNNPVRRLDPTGTQGKTKKQLKKMVKASVSRMEKGGLPTKFIKKVMPRMNFEDPRALNQKVKGSGGVGDTHWDTESNTMRMYEFRHLEQFDPRKIRRYTPASRRATANKATNNHLKQLGAGTVFYHESVHAYFDLQNVEDTQKFEKWTEHYEAEVDRHFSWYEEFFSRDEMAGRLVHEAAGNYAEHRVRKWIEARAKLQDIVNQYQTSSISKQTAQARIQQLRLEYNKDMNEDVFGYFKPDANSTINNQDTGLPPGLKTFIDDTLLEGKIPDQFDSVSVFQKMINSAGLK